MGAFVLGIPEHKLRVVAPDVGGGFGSKIFHYAEEAFVTFAAKAVGRPVKWTSTRSEAFISDAHGRDHVTKIELATDKDGKFLALGPTPSPTWGPISRPSRPARPTYLHGTLMAGNYTTPLIYVNVQGGLHQHRAGRRLPRRRAAGGDLLDRAGHRQGGARARDRPGGDPAEELRQARPVPLPDPGRGELRHRRLRRDDGRARARSPTAPASRRGGPRARARGKLRGFGVATYIEACGIAPSSLVGRARRARRALRERDGAGERHGFGLGLHRQPQPRAGARDDLRAGGVVDARDRREPDRHRARRHRAGARSGWAPTARARWRSAARRSSRRPRRSSPRRRRSPRT